MTSRQLASVLGALLFLAGCAIQPGATTRPEAPCACPVCPVCPAVAPPKPPAKPLQEAHWEELKGWGVDNLLLVEEYLSRQGGEENPLEAGAPPAAGGAL